jgi:methylated-DNA-protein-cysteine methyltransferase related protein
MKKNSSIIIQKNDRSKVSPKKIHRDGEKHVFQQRVLEIVRAIPRGHVLTYGQVAALADTPRAARQVGRILYASGRTVPWQRVINYYGGLSTYKVGSGELQRALLENEGVSFKNDGTLDLNRYQWRPNLRTIKKLNLPEEIAFQINARLPFSRR